MHLLRVLDRAGVLDGIEDPEVDVSVMTGIPEEIASKGFNALLKAKVLTFENGSICMPKFIEAQEAVKSDRQRQRESRDRKRAKAMSQNVTDCHGETGAVTNGHSLPCIADPVPCIATPNIATQTHEDRARIKKHEGMRAGIDPFNANSDPEFMKLWNVCPKKQGQHPAYMAWQQRCDDMTTGQLVEAMEAQASAGMIGGTSKLQLKGWIEGRRWEDEVIETEDHKKSESKRSASLVSAEMEKIRKRKAERRKNIGPR
jgi:hypothetical protein